MYSWSWGLSVGTGHDKAFEEGGFLTHWFLWLPSCHQGLWSLYLLLYLSSFDFGYLFCVHSTSPSSSVRIQLPAPTTKCNGFSFIWENGKNVNGVCLSCGKLQSCSTSFLWLLLMAGWLGRRFLGQVWYQELFWLLTNPVVFQVLVFKLSFYRCSIGSVWCLGIV